MKKQFFLLLVALFCIADTHATEAPYNVWWQKGNQFYEQKQYDSAVFYYEQIANLKPQNAEVYYNLGTTYYRLNKIGLAVLNFERALRINPDYKDASENLVLTQSRISNRILSSSDIFFVNWWHMLTEGKKATFWAVISLIVFLFIIVSLLLKRFRSMSWVSPQLIGISGFLLICLLVLCFVTSQNVIKDDVAIVMENDVPVTGFEEKDNKSQILVPEGTKVEILWVKGNTAGIRLPDGRGGLIPQRFLNRI